MSRVTRTHDNGLLALAVRLGPRELGRVTEHVTLEVLGTLQIWLVLLAGVARSLNNVSRMESAGLVSAVSVLSLDNNFPPLSGLVVFGGNQTRSGPDVELEQSGIRLEKVS